MDARATDHPAASPRWIGSLEAQGMSATWSPQGHCWVRFKKIAHLRYPTNDVAVLTAAERTHLLWHERMAVLQYHELADEAAGDANATLYLCRDKGYSIDSLTANNRSKVRRGLKRLEVRQTSAREILEHGYPAYQDTRDRHGSSAMTAAEFADNWRRQDVVADREIWAAWAGDEIAAFGAVHRCGRWAAISATVSHRAHQANYPNHALFFSMLSHLMADPEVESVSYGLSSLRAETARESLHHFKVSIGLEAVPVVRKVVVHPLLRPGVNRGSLAVARAVQQRAPEARVPRASRAALEFLLQVDDPDPTGTGSDGTGAVAADPGAAPVGEVTVGLARAADALALARLHRACFPAYVSSTLGERFCHQLLATYLARPDVAVLGARDEAGTIAGYVVAAPPSAQRAVNDHLTRAAALATAARAVRSPSEVAALARRARRALTSRFGGQAPPAPASSTDAPSAAARAGGPGPGGDEREPFRVVLIGVAPGARGRRVADLLLAAFAAEGAARGYATGDLMVATENEAAQRCYERNGWIATGDDGAARRFQVPLAGDAPAST